MIEDTNHCRHNVLNMDKNISSENNVDMTDENISGEDTCANGAANQHSHSGGKGVYSYNIQNLMTKSQMLITQVIHIVIIHNVPKKVYNSMKQWKNLSHKSLASQKLCVA